MKTMLTAALKSESESPGAGRESDSGRKEGSAGQNGGGLPVSLAVLREKAASFSGMPSIFRVRHLRSFECVVVVTRLLPFFFSFPFHSI